MSEYSKIPAVLFDYMRGLATHDIALIDSTLADDIRFVTPAKTMLKDQVLDFLAALYRGFPDWSYDHDAPVHCENGSISVRWRQGGTHTATLEFPGFDAYPATGKIVTIPEHDFHYRIRDDQLLEIRPDPVPGGAPRGIFEQIGVEIPPL